MKDRELGELLGVTQSTAWRLRHDKIQKVDEYIGQLQAHLGDTTATKPDCDIDLIADLVELSERTPALRDALIALRKIMHNNA